MRALPRSVALCVTALLVALGSPLELPEAHAQEGIQVRLITTSGWVATDRALQVEVAVNNPTSEAVAIMLLGTLHRPVTSRLELHNLIDDGASGRAVVQRLSDAPRVVRAGGSGRFRLQASWTALGRPRLGVYPLELRVASVEVRRADPQTGSEGVSFVPSEQTLIWSTTTAIPIVVGAPETRLGFVAALPVSMRSPPVPLGGAYREQALAEMELDAMIAALEPAVGAPVVLAPQGSVLDLIEDLDDGALGQDASGELVNHPADGIFAEQGRQVRRLLRDATRRTAPIATGYGRIDPIWLDEVGLGEDAARHLARTGDSQRRVIGRADGSAVHLVDMSRLDAGVLEELLPDEGTVIVGEQALGERIDEPFSPDLFGTSTALAFEGRWRVLVADPRLNDVQDRLPGPEAAQSILAETAIRWLELPLYAPDRLMVFAPPRLPAAGLTRNLLPVLASAPWLRPLTLSEVDATAGTVAAGATPPAATPGVSQIASSAPPALAAAHRAYETAAATIAATDDPVAAARLETWERALLLSERIRFEGELGDALLARDLLTDVRGYTRAIKPAPDRRVTLTSREGTVPIVLENATDITARVQLRLSGRRVRFVEGARQEVELPPGDTTIEVPVEVLGRGEFPITVELRTVGGALLARSSMTLRSTQVSNVALLIVIGGLIYLTIQGMRRRTTRMSAR
ncbi:MAG: DUF6049 family protein [Actinomycetota bacterium]